MAGLQACSLQAALVQRREQSWSCQALRVDQSHVRKSAVQGPRRCVVMAGPQSSSSSSSAQHPCVKGRAGMKLFWRRGQRARLVCLAQDKDGQEPEPSPSTPSSSSSSQPGSPPSQPGGSPPSSLASAVAGLEGGLTGEFCIIEGPDTLQDFARMQLEEIRDNIDSRRNRIFLLMEEIRRLRIQQRLRRLEKKGLSSAAGEEEEDLPEYPSSIPFLPPLTSATLQEYYGMFAGLVFLIITFGGLIAPSLELRLGVGGTSYAEFIQGVGLPMQLSAVDPIVASFTGGAVGVLSALLVVEVNNVKTQEHKKCMYCYGSGYLVCARCSGTGALAATDASAAAGTITRCPNCAGSTKVMCPTCLCTGRALATEHDPRIDPFD